MVEDAFVLDPEDAFEAALIPIVEMNRRKRADYALDGDAFSNFSATANFLGVPRWMVPHVNIAQKLSRISALRANGRMARPGNETVADTILDVAVYGVIAYSIYLHDQ